MDIYFVFRINFENILLFFEPLEYSINLFIYFWFNIYIYIFLIIIYYNNKIYLIDIFK